MATTTAPVPLGERLTRIWETAPGLYGVLATVDHKIIGRRYLVTSMVFLLLGGLEAAMIRTQLARPDMHLVSPEIYNQIFTMHGMTMIFWYAAPVLSGFSNYLWPLMLGARDMACPRANALSYWTFLMSGIFLYTSVLVGQMPDRGWFAYAPLTEAAYSPGMNMDFYAIGLTFLSVSTTVGAINFIATLFKTRAPGMSLNRLPIFVWGTLTTSFAIVFAAPALTAACALLYLDRRVGTHFYDPSLGGSALLWQHLFWSFGHPWVYIVVLPAMGIISDLIPTFCRRPLVGYTFVALATVSTGILGFGVWVHHMFATGLPATAASFFSAASMVITIPSAVAVAAWLATIWLGRPIFKTPMLFAAGFIILFVIGGVSGVATAAIAFDWQLTDTYFVVAHLHYVLIGINVFAVMAGFYYWLPKITGRMLSESLGKLNFLLMFIGFGVGFFPMHTLGLLGMPRRIYTYHAGMGWDWQNLWVTVGAYVFALGVVVFIVNVIWSLVSGLEAGPNPWDGPTLEWATPSPPPPYNFAVIPTVGSRHPLWEDRLGEGESRSLLDRGPVLDRGRDTFGTTPLDAEPDEILRMPKDTMWPFFLSLSILVICYGLLTNLVWLAIVGAVGLLITVAGWFWPQRSMPMAGET
ncbi:MAG: cytochrome c oxidase subunit I [Gemmatimonadaceae bacterium]